jgi:hypothetical protein
MGGSHLEAAEVVALRWELERRRLRRWEPVRQTHRRWRRGRGERSSGSGMEWSGVRRQHLLQIGGRAGRAKREMGGGAAWCRAEEGEWEREGGRGTTAWTMGSEWLQAAWSEAVARTHVGGGQANRGRRWARVTRCG